jgi:hypothetical protein
VSEEENLRAWLRTYGFVSPEEREVMRVRLFKELISMLEEAIDLFGYEAVYFGVGCEVFPDAVDPGWDGPY